MPAEAILALIHWHVMEMAVPTTGFYNIPIHLSLTTWSVVCGNTAEKNEKVPGWEDT